MFQSEMTAITTEGAMVAIREAKAKGKVAYVPGYLTQEVADALDREFQSGQDFLVRMVRTWDECGYFFRWIDLKTTTTPE